MGSKRASSNLKVIFYCSLSAKNGLLLLILLSCCHHADIQLEEKDPYRFFIAGHVSGNPANWHQGFHAPFKEKSYLISQDTSIEFGVLLGDMVKKGSTSNFMKLDEDIGALERPTHIVAGNHDVTDRPLFDQWYGPSYYSFIHNGDLFVVLDSNLDGWNIKEHQLRFLTSTLVDKSIMNAKAIVEINVDFFIIVLDFLEVLKLNGNSLKVFIKVDTEC